MVFIGTSFAQYYINCSKDNVSRGLDIDIVDPDPIKLDYENAEYFKMTAVEYCNMRKL